MDINALISQLVGWITTVVSIGLLLLILAAVVGRYGVRVPLLPATDATSLAWLCAAWWLYRGGKL